MLLNMTSRGVACIALLTFMLLDMTASAQAPNVRRRRERRKATTETPVESTPTPSATDGPVESRATTPGKKEESVYKGRFYTITGTVTDGGTKETMISATVKFKDNLIGTLTDLDGRFKLQVPTGTRIELLVSYIGYATREVNLKPGNQDVKIELTEGTVATEEVVVSASRISERIKESNSTISKVTLGEVRSSTSGTVYENVATLRELDGVNIGVGYRVYNARGFLAVINNRFSQRFDGMEFLVPGNNASAGNLLGPPDIDVENAEVVVGSASALYGSSAVNGLLTVRTRSPWDFEGLTYSAKVGATHLGSPDFGVQPMLDVNLRYSAKINKKLGYKLAASSFIATDWVGGVLSDGTNYAGTSNDLIYSEVENTPNDARRSENPGYDGTNVFGDELKFVFTEANFRSAEFRDSRPISDQQTALRLARTGYDERDLADYNFRSYKVSFALHYRPKPNRELVFSSNVSLNNTMSLIVTRDQMKDFLFHQHRLEYTTPRATLRLYATLQSNPSIVNMNALGASINRSYKQDFDWYVQYLMAFGNQNTYLNNILGQLGRPAVAANNDAAARAFADSDNRAVQTLLAQLDNPVAEYFGGSARPLPGSEAFVQAKQRAISTATTEGGARISDYTGLVNFDWQYDLTKKRAKRYTLQTGGSVRVYRISSGGTYYADQGGAIIPYEYGLFLQGSRDYYKGKLKLSGSLRADGNQDIAPRISPRLAATLAIDKSRRGFLRFSAQQAYRLPTLIQQFQDVNLGPFIQIGANGDAIQRYGLSDNNYLLTAVNSFTTSFVAGSRNDELLNRGRFSFQTLNPERVSTIELGFRSSLPRGNTYIDFSFYYNTYNDFIGLVPVVGGSEQNGRITQLTPDNVFRFNNIQNFQVWSNLNNQFQSFGYALQAETYLHPKVKMTGNFSYIRFEQLGDEPSIGLVDAFNTPDFKCNLAIYASRVIPNFNFGLSTRWVNGFEFVVPNFRGSVPSYAVLDGVIGYTLGGSGMHIKFGANNFLNYRHVEVTFGPTVGSSFFVQLVYDPSVYRK